MARWPKSWDSPIDCGVRLQVQIADARVQAPSGQADSAVAVLNRAVEEAARFDFVIYQFDARLALGEIEIKSGTISAGRNRLETLKKDAQAKQFLLIAERAAKAGG